MSMPPKVDPKDYSGVFRVTDKLFRLKHNPKTLTREEYRDILVELCSCLNDSFDRGLGAAFHAVKDDDPDLQRRAREIVSDLGRFSEFVIFAREALSKCGLEAQTIDAITREIESLRKELGQATYDPDKALGAVSVFRDQVCKGAVQATHRLTQQQVNRSFGRSALVSGGITLIIAGAVSAATAGAATPFSLLAGAAATTMLTTAGVLPEPGKKKPR